MYFLYFVCGLCIIIIINNPSSVAETDTNDFNSSVIFDKPFKSKTAQRKCYTHITKACNGKLERDNFQMIPEMIEIGGRTAHPQEFPHMALIGYGELSNIKWTCGGTLISEKYVLSAAHCCPSILDKPGWIRLGELDYSKTTDDATPKDLKILQIIIHPDYYPSVLYNDIALLKFEKLQEFTEYIRPVCLHPFYNVDDENVFATGWGSTENEGTVSSELRAVNLRIEDASMCDQVSTEDALPYGFNDSIMICAGDSLAERYAYQGDSGGPLQIKLINVGCNKAFIYSQIGIVSHGIGGRFSNIAAIYTKISFYVPWIEEIVWENQF